jgi:hypothetical protein
VGYKNLHLEVLDRVFSMCWEAGQNYEQVELKFLQEGIMKTMDLLGPEKILIPIKNLD